VIEIITVAPCQGEWVVRREGQGLRQTYHNGATAEAAARQLGAALASGGQATEIRIFLRDGSLAGRFACQAAEPAL
jgi:hypothetical protein